MSIEKLKGFKMDLNKLAQQSYINSLTQDLTGWDKINIQLEHIEQLTKELEHQSERLLKLSEDFRNSLDSSL